MANTDRSTIKELSAEQVYAYLRKHPDYLVDHPELLSLLVIPHDTPRGVSSLIERQVATLRSENSRYRIQLSRARTNLESLKVLTDRVLKLSLEIFQTDQATVVCDLLIDFVYNQYAADDVSLFLFLDQPAFADGGHITISDRNDKLRLLLAEVFHRKQPLLDSLQHEHLTFVFGDTASEIHSTVLMPLIGNEWDGLLVIGSRDRDRYHRGPELELLLYLMRVVTIRLDHWLQ